MNVERGPLSGVDILDGALADHHRLVCFQQHRAREMGVRGGGEG
jgi:hypothetical protein